MKLTMLPAGEGDALWLRWGPDDDRRQILVDLGVNATGKALRKRLEQMPVDQRHFDLLVVTHVDTDHIYGILSGLVDAGPLEGLGFDDVWFNGWTHLKGGAVPPFDPPDDGDAEKALKADANTHLFGDNLEGYGGKQGEQFSIWLRSQPWNRAFDGGPVSRPEGELGATISFKHGLRLTILGPTPARLADLKKKWKADVGAALKKKTLDPADVEPDLLPPGLEPMGKKKPKAPKLTSKQDLTKLAGVVSDGDGSKPNGSSIALLVEYGSIRLILSGDAYPDDLVDALTLVDSAKPLELSAFKLPHHGSQNNVSEDLVKAVRCRHWLVSTNGIKHYHPDGAAVARVLEQTSPETPVLHFNEPSTYNKWWDRDDWRKKFDYETVYGDDRLGLTLAFSQSGAIVAGKEFD